MAGKTSTETSTTPTTAMHLCVLVHGLWGNPSHLEYLRKTLAARHPDDRLHILVPKSNADNFTYDGVEVGGERIAHEVEQKVKELEEQQNQKVAKISVIGYSLGGLVSRYAIGLLYKSGLFDRVQPVNFTTFATPHIGVRTPKLGYRAHVWNILGSRTLSISGQQMFLVDDFRESGRPLLSILADSDSIFMKGLARFAHKSLYANTINDRSVPYYTACFSRTDPFVDMEKVDVHYLPDQEEPVVLDPANPVTPRPPPTEPRTIYQRVVPTQQTLNSLPFYIMLFSLMPIALPSFLLNSVYQSYRSSQRVRLHEAGQTGISLGRYRIPLLEEAQAAQDQVFERITEHQREEYLPTPPPERTSSSSPQSSPSEPGSSDEALKLSERENAKEDSPFPVLALTPEQFDMIEHLDKLGFAKYCVHIQKHRHTHAAVIVRIQKEGFSEGREVVRHWARAFEV